MIRHEPVCSHLRFYRADSDDPFQPYDAICTLLWESRTTVWLSGLNGIFDRPMLFDLVRWLAENGVDLVKAHRNPGQKLPFGRVVGDHVEMSVARAAKRFEIQPQGLSL